MFASKHLHHCIHTSGHSHDDIPTSGHSHYDIPTKGHSHRGIPTKGHLHHDILTRSICIVTYPLEGICTTRFLHFHPCKETFALQLNMCAGTIMDKLYIRTPAWDICIIAYLQRSICIMTYPLEGISTARLLHSSPLQGDVCIMA